MNRLKFLLLGLAAAATPAFGYLDLNKNGTMDPYENPALPRAERVADLLARMTLEEKANQLTQAHLSDIQDKRQALVRQGLGSFIFTPVDAKGRNAWQRIAVEETRLGIPLIFGMDVIHGDQLVFPISLGLACAFEPELFERMQTVAAREAAASGIDWAFAPMCDLARDPRWGRVSETCGEDPYLAALCCAAQVRGFQGDDPAAPDRLAACLKHYVGYSAVTGGRDYNDSEITRWTLWNMHLPSFAAGVRAGALTVMSSFNTVEGIPAAANRYTLTDVLRGKLGFGGFVVSDWAAVHELVNWGFARDDADAGQLALNAGNDMDMLSKSYCVGIPAGLKNGTLTLATVDEAVRRVLDVKMRLGLFEHPYVDETLQAKVQEAVDRQERDLARVCAEKSMVLLKNEAVLPLAGTDLKRIALIGPLAENYWQMNGCWSDHGRKQQTTIVEALRKKFPHIEFTAVMGCSINTATPTKIGQDGIVIADRAARPADRALDIKGAVAAAEAADLVVMALGESRAWTGENASRASLGLTGRQQELFDAVAATGKRIVTVVCSGRPLVLPEIWERSAAVLYAWQPGSEGPRALANLLSGEVSPCGRLSMSVPHDVSQLPAFYNRPITGRPYEDCGQYRDTKERGARYPFGYGLTYTTFRYDNLRLTGNRVSCALTNTGAREGTEVVQLYLHQQACHAGWRPICELRGFKRLTLKPGETQEVTFELTPATLGYVDREGRPQTDAGDYRIWLAPNSRDLGKGVVYTFRPE